MQCLFLFHHQHFCSGTCSDKQISPLVEFGSAFFIYIQSLPTLYQTIYHKYTTTNLPRFKTTIRVVDVLSCTQIYIGKSSICIKNIKFEYFSWSHYWRLCNKCFCRFPAGAYVLEVHKTALPCT